MARQETPEKGKETKFRKKRLSRKERKELKKRARVAHQESTSSTNDSSVPQLTLPADNQARDFRLSYIPTPIPSWDEVKEKHSKCKSLGRWFPKAVVLKSSVHYTNADLQKLQSPTVPKASILLFYQYVDPLWPESVVDLLIAYLIRVAQHRSNLGGRIRVAREGLNATLSAVDTDTTSASATLRHVAYDLQTFDEKVFCQTDFKYIDDLRADRHFKDLKLFPVQELVFYGFDAQSKNKDEQQAPLSKGGVHLQPKDFHEMLEQDTDETVVIDVRNHYEAALGRFDGQQQQQQQQQQGLGTVEGKRKSGAEYIDPKMRKSTDFSRWLAKEETQEKLQGKNVMLFCTGGVRCERASAYINKTIGSSVKGVFQLQGGIERYLQEFPDGGHWRGKNFVFDKREAVSAGKLDGDGGVIDRKGSTTVSGVDTKCCLCGVQWDRYVGKKKCSTCGVPVLMCDKCMSDKHKQSEMLARCPLCVEENVTLAADQVEWTNNGLDIATTKEKKVESQKSKAAPSVLKWGGGHASAKKDRRRFKTTVCRYGTKCTRKDCFFSHPERKSAPESSY